MQSTEPIRAVLEAIETFRDLDGAVSLNSVVAFLTVCQREGVSMKELAFLTRMSDETASRAIRALEAPEAETALRPALGLVEIVRGAADTRRRLIHLTDEGRRIRDQIAAEVRENACTNVSM
jgi:DNA-binding MarR family transcriptional regulator